MKKEAKSLLFKDKNYYYETDLYVYYFILSGLKNECYNKFQYNDIKKTLKSMLF